MLDLHSSTSSSSPSMISPHQSKGPKDPPLSDLITLDNRFQLPSEVTGFDYITKMQATSILSYAKMQATSILSYAKMQATSILSFVLAVYFKVQQQTTWNEIPEKTNSSSSLTKNTLCTFIKFLRAPNPKPGVH
ncbi:unnamed protein product [Sphagnum compactum]